MEEKLTFTRVPDSLSWLCVSQFQRSRKSYAIIIDYFNQRPDRALLLQRALPTGEGRPSIEAQLSGYGVKGFRDRLSELYLFHLENGFYPETVSLKRSQEIAQFERRFESFSTLRDYRAFLLGMYLKARDLECLAQYGREGGHFEIPLEVDEVLAAAQGKAPRLDWTILSLSCLAKLWGAERFLQTCRGGSEALLGAIGKLDDKEKMIFFYEMSSYGHAIGEQEFFLYQKV